LVLDKPEKTLELIAVLKAAAPFEVELPPSLIAHLRTQGVAFNVKPRHTVSKVFYAGDEGGILCHIEPDDGQKVLIVSITHLQLRRSLPFAAAVLDYQKHRIKKLKQQNGSY
jgi:hypothetical protein